MESPHQEPEQVMPRFKLPLPVLLALLASQASFASEPLNLSLPTDNDAIVKGKPEAFYMYTDRNFEGESSKPWQAGQFGFVRNMKRVPEGVIGTRFHEGVDIRPVKRDSAGRPRDEVRAIATGVVAHTNKKPAASNYGNYVVVEHNWGYGPVFSLYAHLSEVDVEPGQRVLTGFKLGRMGYTGAGLNRERAHVHLELALFLSLRFDEWRKDVLQASKNDHGLHNGLNLSGLDFPSLYLRLQKNPDLTIPAFLKSAPVYYKVTVPRRGPLELTERYPWLRIGDHTRPSPSWELSFSASGLPLGIAPSHRNVSKPLVTFVRTTQSRHEYYTLSRVAGAARRASLTPSGLRYIKLVTGDF
jgi:murein DD-endopeptidase MepM/ murein hydrolase activator NlpD